MLNILRQQYYQQQYLELRDSASAYWRESGDVDSLPLLAMAYVQLGQRSQALDTLKDIQNYKDSLSIASKAILGAVLVAIHNKVDGIEMLGAVLQEEPSEAVALCQIAYLDMLEGDLKQALDKFSRAFNILPGMVSIWQGLVKVALELAEISVAQTTLNTAIENFTLALDSFSETSQTHQRTELRRAQLAIWIAAGQYAEAEQWLASRQADIEEHEWVQLVKSWARLLMSRHQFDEAQDVLIQARAHYPDNLALHVQMAELTQLLGRGVQSLGLMRKALNLAETAQSSIGMRIQLMAQYIEMVLPYSLSQAESTADDMKSLLTGAIDSFTQETQEALGIVLDLSLARLEVHQQDYTSAQARFQSVLNRSADLLPALMGYGQLALQCGDFEKAIELFNKARDIDPVKGFTALMNAKHFPSDPNILEQLERQARSQMSNNPGHASLLLRLASAWEKEGDFDKAMKLANEANSIIALSLPYKPKEHRQHCARVRHAFPKALFEHRKHCGIDSQVPVFVVGMPRSGTTLIEQIIASHSQVYGAGELGIIPSTIAGLNRWERQVGSGRLYPDCADDIDEKTAQGIAEDILRQFRELDSQATYVVDKLPHNFENIGLIKLLFPRAKIISVRRDPRDIAVSNYFTDFQARHGGLGYAYNLTHIGEQLADHNLMMHHWHQVFPHEILEISYEAVIEDLEQGARCLLDYLQLPWEDGVLSFNELDRPIKTASLWQVRQPVYTSSRAKWKRYENYLRPLIEGTNAKIEFEPINMPTLYEPGLLHTATDAFRKGDMDSAQQDIQRLLKVLPTHAAANCLAGMLLVEKGYVQDGVARMEDALMRCPWNHQWRNDLIAIYQRLGKDDEIARLQAQRQHQSA